MTPELITMRGAVALEAADSKKPRTLRITAYSGGMMSVDGFGNVVIALNGIDLPASLPILADHENRLDAVIASGTARVDRGQLRVDAQLADSPAAQQVLALVASGVPLQASIGARPTKRVHVPAGQAVLVNNRTITAPDRGLTVVEASELREVSVVAVAADPSTTVSISAAFSTFSPSLKGPSLMTNPANTPAVDPVQAAVIAERERLAEIDRVAYGNDLQGHLAQQLQAARAKAVAGEISIDALRAVALDALRASRSAPGPHFGGGRNYASTPDHLTAAMMVRAGFSAAAEKEFGANVMEQSRPLHQASLVDLCRAALTIDGQPIPSSRDGMIRAAMTSTGSMSVALSNTANKVLLSAYMTAPASWRSFAAVKSVSSFKTHTGVRPSFPFDLAQLPPGGEVTHGTYSEETYEWSVDTFARQLGIDRRDIVNDDLGAFSEVIPGMARAAARSLSSLVITTLLANADSFFGSGNANYFEGAATNLQASSLATAIQKLRQQKDSDGDLLDLQPSVLLVSPENEQVAKALVASSSLQRYVASGTDQMPMGNPFLNAATIVVEPRLSDSSYSGYSATAWYLFSAPENCAQIVGFLDGMQAPTIQTFGYDSDVDRLAISFRCYHDFGTALADHRAAVKSKGAA